MATGRKDGRCCKCHDPAMPGQGYCRSHHAESMRRTRPKHWEMSPEQRQRAICRAYTNVLIRRGKIARQPCRVCGEPAQARHRDYSDPRNLDWLCVEHRLELVRVEA